MDGCGHRQTVPATAVSGRDAFRRRPAGPSAGEAVQAARRVERPNGPTAYIGVWMLCLVVSCGFFCSFPGYIYRIFICSVWDRNKIEWYTGSVSLFSVVWVIRTENGRTRLFFSYVCVMGVDGSEAGLLPLSEISLQHRASFM